jgi:hypothetical protein
MADIIFNNFNYNLARKAIDMVNDTIRVALCSSSLVPSATAHNVWSDISSYEIVGSGYTAGGQALASKTVTQDETNGGAIFDAADVTWGTSVITARYAVLYDVTASNILIACFDFISDKISSGGDFVLQWNTNGILKLN